MNILKNNLSKKYEIIDIQCGVECDLEIMLNIISSQIEKIMTNHKIYINNSDIVHKYFQIIRQLTKDTDYKFISHIVNVIDPYPKNFL